MTDLYLIAHRVRGEPAFDIACQMICPECDGGPNADLDRDGFAACVECDNLGYWWIIPTSGHRAYPYWNIPLGALMHDTETSWDNEPARTLDEVPPMPPSLPDHYPTRAAPTISLIDTLGLRKPKPQATSTPIARRF